MTLKGRHGTLELTREVASERRWFKKQSFWEILIPALEACSPSYLRYSYSDRADVYEAPLSMETIRRLQACAGLLKYAGLARQLEYLEAESAEIVVER